jgi:hypothetical protein
MSDQAIQELTGHYRDTFEVTYRLWEQRNRVFLALLAVVGIGSVALYRLPAPPGAASAESTSVIVKAAVAIASSASPLPGNAAELAATIPYPLVHAAILVSVFYMMVNLFHRSATVLRNYGYLKQLEGEIRGRLALGEDSIAFTREGEFYWSNRPAMFGMVKYFYTSILGGLLGLFFYYRLSEDVGLWLKEMSQGNGFLVAIDLLVFAPTALVFAGYVLNTLGLDRDPRKVLPTSPQETARPG